MLRRHAPRLARARASAVHEVHERAHESEGPHGRAHRACVRPRRRCTCGRGEDEGGRRIPTSTDDGESAPSQQRVGVRRSPISFDMTVSHHPTHLLPGAPAQLVPSGDGDGAGGSRKAIAPKEWSHSLLSLRSLQHRAQANSAKFIYRRASWDLVRRNRQRRDSNPFCTGEGEFEKRGKTRVSGARAGIVFSASPRVRARVERRKPPLCLEDFERRPRRISRRGTSHVPRANGVRAMQHDTGLASWCSRWCFFFPLPSVHRAEPSRDLAPCGSTAAISPNLTRMGTRARRSFLSVHPRNRLTPHFTAPRRTLPRARQRAELGTSTCFSDLRRLIGTLSRWQRSTPPNALLA